MIDNLQSNSLAHIGRNGWELEMEASEVDLIDAVPGCLPHLKVIVIKHGDSTNQN